MSVSPNDATPVPITKQMKKTEKTPTSKGKTPEQSKSKEKTASTTSPASPAPAAKGGKNPPSKNRSLEKEKQIDQAELDTLIWRHLHTNIDLMKYDTAKVLKLCRQVCGIFAEEPRLLRVSPEIIVVGDIHGQYADLLHMFQILNTGGKHGALAKKYVFLGDYIDRGPNSLETIVLIFLLKVRYPKKYYLLRGNHECWSINMVYGFATELKAKFGPTDGELLWREFNKAFGYLPFAALIGQKILCMHGGISPQLRSLQQIENIPSPLDDPIACPLALDMLWSDPKDSKNCPKFSTTWYPNTTRGISWLFDKQAVEEACHSMNVSLIIRAHQVEQHGFGFMLGSRKLLTVFTAPNYSQNPNNDGAIVIIHKSGQLSFRRIQRKEGVDTDEGKDNKKKGEKKEEDNNRSPMYIGPH